MEAHASMQSPPSAANIPTSIVSLDKSTNTNTDDGKYNLKSYSVYSNNNGIHTSPIVIREILTEENQTFLWQSALVLSLFIVSNSVEFVNCKCLEIGSGVGLPSITAAKIGSLKCFVTERMGEKAVLANLEYNIEVNNVSSVCSVLSIDWDDDNNNDIIDDILSYGGDGEIDILLGSDVFYSSVDFDSILFIFLSLLERNPNAIFYTSYQQRSCQDTLVPYLDKYSMSATDIPLASFIHRSHLHQGSCEVAIEDAHGTATTTEIVDLKTFDDIYLLKIQSKTASHVV